MREPTVVLTFDGDALDADIWTAAYLPAWSSLHDSRATYRLDAGELVLSVPPDQGLWCADLHPTPLRVSAVQTGNRSGPVGSHDGQQPFRDDLRVREAQAESRGLVVFRGRIEVACRAVLTSRSMFSAWLVGFEDEPDRCGEICIVEVFGEGVDSNAGVPTAAMGRGIHPFRDPALVEEFAAPRSAIDVAELHRYAVEWTSAGVDFLIDGRVVAHSGQSPDYPMQLILGLFDFPDGTVDVPLTPSLMVREVTWTPPADPAP